MENNITDKDTDKNINITDTDTDKDINTDKGTDKDINTDKGTDKDINTDKGTDKDINTDKGTDKDINITDKEINLGEIIHLGEIDYAILKSVANNMTIVSQIVDLLQIRTLIVEKHIYFLVKEGFLNVQLDHFIITSKGYEAIHSFESKSGNWRSIEEFIISEIKKRKEQKLKTYKIVNFILLASMIILIILVIYFGLFY